MSQRSGTRSRFRMFLARTAGRVDRQGNIKPREKGDTFKTIMALMLALVTIMGAVVAWRSAVAGNFAGDTADSAILASLNLQQASTNSSTEVSQHRAAHLEFFRYLSLASAEIDQATADIANRNDLTTEEINAILRPIIEHLDLGITDRLFFDVRYLDEDDTYDGSREQAEQIAEAAQTKDVDPDPQFVTADTYRSISVAFIAALILLAIALWFFAVSETIEHVVKYATALGGLAFMIMGCLAAWAIEAGTDLAQLYRLCELITIITFIAVAIGVVGLLLLSRLRSQPRGPQHAEHDGPDHQSHNGDEPGEEGFRRVVTLLIASVTVFAAVVGWLQADAGVKNDAQARYQQRFASQALGTEATGRALVNFQYSTAYRALKELLVQKHSAQTAGDTAAEDRFSNVISETLKLTEPITDVASDGNAAGSLPLSSSTPAPSLLAPPYFDPNGTAAPDLAGYEADVYVTKQTELTERSSLAGDLNNAWQSKADSYIVHLTLLAAALALFGLSLSFTGLARPLFVTVGIAITLVTAGSVASVYSQPVTYVPDAAVQAYARGVGLEYRGKSLEAVAAYDEALKLSPDYATALSARGDAHFSIAGPEGYIAAAKDYEAAQSAGKDTANVAWNLGWVYYLQGRFDDSIKMSRHSLDLNPNQAGVRLNLALAQLASGKLDDARAGYRDAMDKVAQQVATIKASGKKVPPSLWFYLDASGRDLESLFFRLEDLNLTWMEAPEKSAISDPKAVQDATAEMFRQLKSYIVSLENTGRPPADPLTASIDTLSFGAKASGDDAEYKFADSFTAPVKKIDTKFNFSGMRNGQTVEWKVFVNGDERPEFRLKTVWDKGESGAAEQPFGEEYAYSNIYSFETGDYIIEMYVDNQFAQIGSFDIQP